jgi:CubicO group peptidase (beta-lactamase class C family)
VNTWTGTVSVGGGTVDGVTLFAMIDWEAMTGMLGDLEPLYPPGSRSTYQAMSYGWLLGEVVRRTDPKRRSFGDFVRDEVCRPLTQLEAIEEGTTEAIR